MIRLLNPGQMQAVADKTGMEPADPALLAGRSTLASKR